MKRKIICIGITSMFLLIGLTALSSVGKEINALKPLSDNTPPEMEVRYRAGDVVYSKRGMTASFSAFGKDADGDQFALYVSIHKEGSTPTTYDSESTHKWDKILTVDIPLPPEDYPIGTKAYYSMWIQDEHGAESDHKDDVLEIVRTRSKNINLLFQMFFKNYPNLVPLLRLLQKLQQ